MILHCPVCRQEFDQGRDLCTECGGALVEGPGPLEPSPEPELGPLDATGDVVAVGSSANEAEIRFLEGLLRSEEIPTLVTTQGVDDLGVYGGTPVAFHLLMVPRERRDEAAAVTARVRQHQPLEGVRFEEPEEEQAPAPQVEELRKPSYGTAGTAFMTLLFAAGVTIAVGFAIFPPAEQSHPSGIFRSEERGISMLQIGGLALSALLGGGLGIWVARRRTAILLVVILLLAIFVLPMFIMLGFVL